MFLFNLLFEKIRNPDFMLSDLFVSRTRGERGEKLAERRLKQLDLNGKKSFVVHNVYIPKGNGETTEIDLIFISEKGLFVVESKDFSGWIFGRGTDRMWTQCLPNGKKYSFYNPILQNQSHIKWIKNYLQNDTIHFTSLIVFSNRCTLKNVTFSQPDTYVIYLSDMVNTIRRLGYNLPDSINSSDLWDIVCRLDALSTSDPDVQDAHIQHLQHQFQKNSPDSQLATPIQGEAPNVSYNQVPIPQNAMSTEQSAALLLNHPDTNDGTQNSPPLICPRCGAPLVLRTARRGQYAGNQFYGCSAYPKCSFIRNL